MSLINDALKKAQKQRTGEAPPLASLPSVGGESAHRIARRAKPAGFDTLMVRAGVGLGVALVVIAGGYFAFRSSPAPSSPLPAPSSPAQSASPDVGGPSASANPQVSALSSQVSGVPPSAPAFTLPVAQVPAPKPEPAAPVQKTENREPRTAPAQTQSSSPVAKPRDEPSKALAKEGAAAKLEPRAIQFIENIKVAGIMARATDSKVLMNDRVYRLGSIVEAELGLRLVDIATNALTFEDERGGRYTRTF